MKYKLIIPEQFLDVVSKHIRVWNGDIRLNWAKPIKNTGWLHEIKEPVTKEKFIESLIAKNQVECHRCWIQGNRNGWEAGRENLLLQIEQDGGLDIEKEKSATTNPTNI